MEPIDQYNNIDIDLVDVRDLVLSYLVHNCYKETLDSLMKDDSSSSCTRLSLQNTYIDERKKIMSLLQQKKVSAVEEAMKLSEKIFPSIWTEKQDIHFMLECQRFIEFIRERNPKNALQFAQAVLSPFPKRNQKYLETMTDVVALVAYAEPETSPVGYLLSNEYAESVGLRLNSAILEHLKIPPIAPLDHLVRHLTVLRDRLHTESSKKYGKWTIQDFLQDAKVTKMDVDKK
eukprot:Phypoly_transcript_16808.p1 GENE.Phypoly_transcript_16808~~Phypoly_transcript_16808.p1  ORF type:complete len:232 (+),score=21.16 Phypoly_transcript_16808:49-744(+)